MLEETKFKRIWRLGSHSNLAVREGEQRRVVGGSRQRINGVVVDWWK